MSGKGIKTTSLGKPEGKPAAAVLSASRIQKLKNEASVKTVAAVSSRKG